MNRGSYRKTARWYDTLVEPLNRDLRAIAMRMFPAKEGMSVLDVGCGTGTHLDLYQEGGCKVSGIDSSPAMLEVAREKLGERVELCLGDASSMVYPDETFDLVLVFLALHEMPAPVRSAVLREAKRVIKKSGRILLVDYHSGPIRFPNGWLSKLVITFFEIAAGREHFRNYRDFLARQGLPTLIATHELSVEKKKIVGGGNLGLFLLSLD
jgi:demethylmenaquinone methyltransferase/2-methoxy-6-polyprenyl-1,4-benzoquinol methylase